MSRPTPSRQASRRALAAAGAAAALLLLAVAGPSAGSPPPVAADALAHLADTTGPPALVNDEVAVATLDPTGLPERAVLISRVTATGPAREITDPASLTNVRFLDRLGRPEVSAEGVLLTVGGDSPSALTQARFDKPLPVALHAEYSLDGRVVPAAEVPGTAGELGVTYTLTNTTAQQEVLSYTDAAGETRTSTQSVFAPFQGVATVTLPIGAQLVDDGGAMLATDDQGRTLARWNVSLYPPLSAPIQQIGYTMRTARAAIPAVAVELTPATVTQDPGTDLSSTLLTGAVTGNESLYAGLEALDSAAGQLATGSETLSTGLSGLASGADAASAAAGALAAGAAGVADGADRTADASAALARGVGVLSGGAAEVAHGTAELAGALGTASSGADSLAAATRALADAAGGSPVDSLAPLIDGGAQIEAGLLAASARIGSPSDPVLELTSPIPPDQDATCPPGGTAPPDDDCVTIYQGVRALRDAVASVVEVADAMAARAEAARQAIAQLIADLESINADILTAAQGAADLLASVCGPTPTLDPVSCEQLQAVADAAADAAAGVQDAAPVVGQIIAVLTALDAQAVAILGALHNALDATERLLAGVAAVGSAVGRGTPNDPGLATAMAALNAGLRELATQLAASQRQLTDSLMAVALGSEELADGLGEAVSGADALASGSAQLAEGTGAAEAGAEALADGSALLADGATAAADGSDRLSFGLDDLAAGTGAAASAGSQVAAGARALQEDGTQPAASGVLDASTDPALAEAWLEAASARASDALPYGPPEGAVGHVAYVLTLEEVPAPRSLWERITGLLGIGG
jgi:X-X-X-Leu-X-X-Gly heptad repeat protein